MSIKNIIIESIYKFLSEEREIFKTLYHGTDLKSALEIKQHGIDISKSEGGYFGWGFYTTPNYNLAKSNYSEFSGDEDGGVIMEFELLPNSNILDLRNAEDFETWKQYANQVYDKNLHKKLVNNGIDGLWDDSFDGVVIYNPNVLTLKKIHK
ncbi:MAG: hypothetical protein ACOCVF_01840 [bacterium]